MMRTSWLVVLMLVATVVFADPPKVLTPSPVIYLADNLDEARSLGWCIDTVGRGYSDKLHAHSCKPQGGDVQFSYDTDSGQIRSVAFDGKCMTVLSPDSPLAVVFGLTDCVSENPAQQFLYDTATGQFSRRDELSMCIVVGEQSRSAGPFQSRDLGLMSCSNAPSAMSRWIMKP